MLDRKTLFGMTLALTCVAALVIVMLSWVTGMGVLVSGVVVLILLRMLLPQTGSPDGAS